MEQVLKTVITWAARALGIDEHLFESRWNIGVSVLTSAAFIVISALLVEPTITSSVQKKLGLWFLLSLVGILLSTRPKMTIAIGTAVTGVRWLVAGILMGSLLVVLIAIGLGGIIWILIQTDPAGTGFYVDRKH